MKSENSQTASVVKSETEWKNQLTPEQFRILRQDGTEPPNGQAYQDFKSQGTGYYSCAGCDTKLFSSEHKFDARCGWPSFFDSSDNENIVFKTDHHLGYARTEVRCAVCDGHLGHIFEGEGYNTPTDQRYCINGTVLVFKQN